MRPIDGDALLEKFNRKADIMTALTDEDTANDFAFFCKLADAVEEMPTICGWISVKDGLPEEDGLCTVYCKDGSMAHAWFEDKWFIDHCECEAGYVTHWMELPEPPKDGESGILDYKAVVCLKAVQTITKYLDAEEQSCGCTYWIDKKGYSFGTDIGYFFEGLERFEGYLIKRLRRAVIESDETD